ncbi:MAG: peptidylprolyl isomerase [Chlamydiales bacterium]|nr:peptidylprolyl isomerase [Chlamydiales bacterium]
MKKILLSVFALALFVVGALFADSPQEPRKRIVVNNRVLASVNGNVISVIDVKKKMDMLLYQHYPQYMDVPEARFEFYNSHWREVLNDLIDRDLMMADSEEKGFPISSGDVREELEDIFGPDVMLNLDSAGLTLDEAWKLVKADITIRRMLYYQVRMRITPQITPNEIRKAYDEKVKTIGQQKECVWRCVTLKSDDVKVSTAYAEKILALLEQDKIALDKLQAVLDKKGLTNPDVQMLISQPFRQKQGELSSTLQDLLLSMKEGTYSKPLLQSSRSEAAPVVRIYYVQELKNEAIPSLAELEPTLREEITQEMTAKKTAIYLDDLRRHFHLSKEQIEKELPVNFQPFVLK